MRVELERVRDDNLERETWSFYLDDGVRTAELVLSEYQHQWRPTRRHGWRTADFYSIYNRRESTLASEKVPFNEGLAKEAKAAAMAQITVVVREG